MGFKSLQGKKEQKSRQSHKKAVREEKIQIVRCISLTCLKKQMIIEKKAQL